MTLHPNTFVLFIVAVVMLFFNDVGAQATNPDGSMEVGLARIDITPTEPIRLAGYAGREKKETEEVLHRLEAKAIAFGSDAQKPSIFITVDLIGIPGRIRDSLANQLAKKINLDPAHLAICASHTHGGPEVGNLLNILQQRPDRNFSDSLLALNQMIHIAQYTEQLGQKLEQLSLEAIQNRHPMRVAWGQGQAHFARNRRVPKGPVDPTLPLLRVSDLDGQLRAVLVSYACHGTALSGKLNKINGDWISEAQYRIEANHPGAMAMVAIGCGADADPEPRGKIEDAASHGQQIADKVDRLLTAQLEPLTTPPAGRIKWVELPFSHVPTVPELIKQTEDKSAKGYYARRALNRIARGYTIPASLSYPVQTWTFGDKLAMINLAGEVVVDYAIRLKHELGAEHIWVNAYANDAPCYIASRRVIWEGGYEAEGSMYYYDKPSSFVEEVEDITVAAVHDLLPASYTTKRDTVNHPEVIHPKNHDTIQLRAEDAKAVGPTIEYIPEWKAFGWFTVDDQVEWEVEVDQGGMYEVFLEWSVSDKEAGKTFALEAKDQELKGKIGQTGSWFTYKKEKKGHIDLSAGRQKVIFKSGAASEKGTLLDLREVTLVLVE